MASISTKLNFSHLLTVAFVFFLTLPSKPVLGFDQLRRDHGSVGDQESYDKKMVLGSRPPGCVNKCLNCRPCKATLVIPTHQKKRMLDRTLSHGGDDDEGDSYYLLSWKCRCGTKLFHP